MTMLAEGSAGHLPARRSGASGSQGERPQTWALGVKEVWKVPRPLGRIIHTLGWPLRSGARYREFGGSFVYPMGEEHVSIGMVVGLDHRDAELSAHDLLQELKTHPTIRAILDGGERVEWGAKTIPEGGFVALPRAVPRAGAAAVRRRRRARQRAGAEGNPLRDRVGPARGRGGVGLARAAASSAAYDDALRASFVWSDLRARAQHAAVVLGRAVARRALVGRRDGDGGPLPARRPRRQSATTRTR